MLSRHLFAVHEKEMSLKGSTSFGFAQNMIHGFQNTLLNSYWHCLRQMPQNYLAAGLYLLLLTTEKLLM